MRRHPDSSGNLSLNEGDYGQNGSGVWHVHPPGQHVSAIPHHVITEHRDGTVTAIPSIVLRNKNGEEIWHGTLIRGKFTEETEGGER